VIGQPASQWGGQSTLAAGTVFESTVDTFLRIQSDIEVMSSTAACHDLLVNHF